MRAYPELSVEVGLGQRGNKPLPTYSCTPFTTKGVELATVVSSAEAILPFLEVGNISGHCYQPNVNHRSFDPKVLYNCSKDKNGADVPPLLKSLLNPRPEDNFTLQTPFSIFMYEMNEVVDDNHADIDSATMIRTILPCKIKNHPTQKGRLKDRFAGPVGMRSFKLLLRLFDLYLPGSNGSEISDINDDGTPRAVTPLEWTSFFAAISDIDTKTHTGFKEFLTRHSVPGFKVDETLSMPQLRLLFNRFVRSITGIRASAFDCQHRLYTMAWVAFGYFTPSNKAPLYPSKELTKPYTRELLKVLGGLE